MGDCSTMDIPRDDAVAEIMGHLFTTSDEKIGYDRCYNFSIVSGGYTDPDEAGYSNIGRF